MFKRIYCASLGWLTLLSLLVMASKPAELRAASQQTKQVSKDAKPNPVDKKAMDALTLINTHAQKILDKYVSYDLGVDYIGLNKEFKLLEDIVEMHERLSLRNRSQDELKAIYINLYNFAMMYHVLSYAKKNNLSVSSKKFLNLKMNKLALWSLPYTISLNGVDVSLDQVEHGLIRGQSSTKAKVSSRLQPYVLKSLDARIHASVNCGAVSCPRVREQVLTEKNIDTLLQRNFVDWVSSPYHFAKKSKSNMWANQIIYWYFDDFDQAAKKRNSKSRAGSYLASFVDTSTPTAQDVKSYLKKNPKMSSWDYDWHYQWRINDQRNQRLIRSFK